MRNIGTLLLIAVLGVLTGRARALEVVHAGRLSLEIIDTGAGVRLEGIRDNEVELLNKAGNSEVFSLEIQTPSEAAPQTITSSSGWHSVRVRKSGAGCVIRLARPINPQLPKRLEARVAIRARANGTDWDLSVKGLGSGSLLSVRFPYLNIKATADGSLLLPHYSGKLISDPLKNPVDVRLLYPRGWSASMQFAAYYDKDRGLYFGFHDPVASLKTFVMKTEHGGVGVGCELPAPNKTVRGNDWRLPGCFRLELFHGDWYDAAQIYRKWVFANADYRPRPTPARKARQKVLGDIGLWIYYYSSTKDSQAKTLKYLSGCADYFADFPLGIHWYQWNFKKFDNDYPHYFPELPWLSHVVHTLQASGRVCVMPYINGRLFDTDLPDYPENGKPYATRKEDGEIFSQHFSGNRFAVMCPTQAPWQRILGDAVSQLAGRIGAAGVYIDQVCAATPVQCMAPKHGHPLGGGHWWRDGYRKMFQRMHVAIAPGKFLTVEGGTDYLVDQVDGFLVQGWTTDHLVPAFPAVYSGQVQLFGIATGTSNYHRQKYYCKNTQTFVFGIQPGRASSYIVFDPNAADMARPFVRRLGILRYKLRRFLAYGRMLSPLRLHGDIPTIASTWKDYGRPVKVTVSTVQNSVWRSEDGKETAFVFVNASMDKEQEFSFEVDDKQYGLGRHLTLRTITESGESVRREVVVPFNRKVRLRPLAVKAYVLAP